jgi:tetratricopeptide (TPR) repeat protein
MSGKSKKEGVPKEAHAAPSSSSPPVSPVSQDLEIKGPRPPGTQSWTAHLSERWQVVGVCLFLAAIIWVVFSQTAHHGFINYDDGAYIVQNSGVTNGVTYHGVVWAFTWVHAGNWHPVTWISHMMDCQIYGLNPGGHHLTNVLIHTATAILLFLNLRGMTGNLWRSAFVAAVFAIHPLRVESVAWISERKDVLSGLFFMLTIGAYVRYARRRWSAGRYGLVLLMYAMGLMSKPMLVTVPLVLWLLDYWPLNRFRNDPAARPNFRLAGKLILEKVPLLVLSVAVCAITIVAQHGTIQQAEESSSLSLRLGNVLNSYVVYLGQMFWPVHLVVLYPFPHHGLNISGVILSAVLLAGISAGAFILQRRRYLLTGWLWYLIMLVPVIGIVKVGFQSHADRYTYLPQIGLYLLLTWATADLCANWRYRRLLLGGGATVILTALTFCAHTQASYWRNSESLWEHALAYTKDNYIAENSLGYLLLKKGDVDGAIAYCQKALELKPDFVDAHNNLGNALLRKGRVDEAIIQFQKALEIMPDNVDAYNDLGNALLKKGLVDEAIIQFKKALAVEPNNKIVRDNLENALLQKGSVDEVVIRYREALQATPDNAGVLNNLAWLLATCPDGRIRNGVQAVTYAQRACQLTQYSVAPLAGTLAAAYAEAGRYDEAIAMEEKACDLAAKAGDEDLLRKSKELLALYKTHQPFHGVAEKFIPVTP